MATYQTTSNRRRTAGTFTPTENRKTGVGAFTPTENRSYDSAIVYGWERQNKEAYDILEQYRSKISSGGYLSAEDLAAYKNAADIYTKTSTDLWNLSKNFGQDQKMDDASFRNSMAALQQNYTDVYNYYTQFENEAAYQEAYQANQVYQGHLNADLGQLQTEMDAMKPVMDEASEIYAQIASFNPYAYADPVAAEKALKDRLAEITSPWGGYEKMQSAYSEKEQYYNLSKRYQEWAKLEDVVNNADFEAKSKFVGPSKNGAQEDGQYDVIYDEDYEYWLENHYDEWYDPNNDVYDHFTYMTPEEKAIFIYHYNTGGKTAADEYDKSIQDRQNNRWADERTKLDNGSTMAALQAHFWAAVGNLGRQIKGTWNMVTGSAEYIPTGQFEYYGANAREELADNGPKLLGHSLGQLAFDFLQNTANQAPSMAIGAVAGPGAGSAALGIGAAGNAYADMINAGYSKGQARTYATLVGGSEAGLSYLLDAIPYFGGKLSSKITSSILDKVDNVLARVAIKMGSNFGSEALEEGLQAVLEPWFKEVATNIQQDRPDWEEVAYESLLGGLSGLVLGSPGNIAEAVNTSRAGQQLISEGVTAQDLTNLGLEFDSDSSQYGLAQRVNDRIDSGKKVNSYTMGRMWQDFSTEMTAQNTAALTQALQERGLSAKQANNLVEYFFSLTEEAQAIVMENSQELSDAVQEVLLNPESQSGRRTQAYNAVQRKLSGQSEVKATSKEEPKISKDGQTYRTDTGEAVESLQIESVGNGKISYKVGDQTLGKEDIEYSSEQEAMLHDVMSSSRTLTVQAANFMAQHVDPNNSDYINEAIDSYQAGWYGYSESKLDRFTMPKSQSYELYAYGKKAKAEYEAKQKQAQAEAKAAAEAGKKPKGTSGVYFTDMKGHTVAFDEAKQHLTPKQEAGVDTAKFLNKLGLGGEFVFFRSERINGKWMFRDSKGNLYNAPNGMYIGKNGRIYIDLNTFAGSSGATLYTLAHELTHFIENNAPEQYKVLADFLINEYDKTGKSMDERVKDKQKELEYLWDRDVSYDEAFHEVVADSMQKLFNDGNLQNELVKLKQSSPEGAKVVQAIKDFLDKLIKRIRNIYAKLATGSEDAETVVQMGESLQKLQKIFAAALVEASDNYTAYGAVVLDTASETQYSTKNDGKFMNKAIDQNAKSNRVAENVMRKAQSVRAKIANRLTAIREAGKIAIPEDIEGNTFFGNSAYGGSEENTTICPRSLAAEAFVDAVSELVGRPLTVEEQIYISQDLQQPGRTLTPECTYCYVATDRKAYRAFLGEYIKQRDSVIEAYKNGNTDTARSGSLYQEFLNGRKDTDNMWKRFSMWINAYKNGTPMVESSHLTSVEKLMGDIQSEFGKELKAQIKDAMAYAQSASWAKKRVGYVAYNGHILKWKQDRINKLNSHYGLRMYSFSDFSPAFILENMQMITDAAVRGLKMLGYTKELDFVKIFAPSGMNINISTFGFEMGGNVYENNIIGANWTEAQKLRAKHPNVGITFVATNDTLVEWALEQDWIDVVIPYHLVRTGKELAQKLGFKDYTGESADVKTKDWMPGDQKSIAPTEHNNDKATYLEALQKNHLRPRFERYIDHPNYMKLVNECRQSASESKAVQPIFDETAANESLAKLEANGYYQPIGGTVDRMYEIATDIADDIANGRVQFQARKDTHDGYGGIREVIAKKGLDELSKKLGNRFPLSAAFDATMRADKTPLVIETVLANGVQRAPKESAFSAAKRAFRAAYGSKTSVYIKQMGIDADLYVDVAKESIDKAQGKPDEQITLDVISHIRNILENSILMGIERIAHTAKKGTVLYGYRLYNLYWYQNGNKKTPNCLVCTVAQNLDKAEGYVFRNIENVTVRHGLPGNNTGMPKPSNGNIYTVSQLYDAVKKIDRDNGGLKYSDAQKDEYLFNYTERNDGASYQARPSEETSNRYLLANALESAAQTDEERQKLQQYKEKLAVYEKAQNRLDTLNQSLFKYSTAKIKNIAKIEEFKNDVKGQANTVDAIEKSLTKLEQDKALAGVIQRQRAEVQQRIEAEIERRRAEREQEVIDRFRETKAAGMARRGETMPEKSVGAAAGGFSPIDELQHKYGNLPEGENPVRPDDLPKSTDGKNKVSLTARTVKGAEVTPDAFSDLIDKEVVNGKLTYLPISNNDTTQKAIDFIRLNGWEAARGAWSARVRKGEASAEMSAIGALLLNHAAQAGDEATWLDVLGDYTLMGTRAGQAVQAMRILKKLAPADNLYMIEKSIEKMASDLKLDIEIDPKLKEEYTSAKSKQDRDEVLKKIQKEVARQVPTTIGEMWTALRYTNMLGNLKTQVRNVLGNVSMSLTNAIKNKVAASLELLANKVTGGKVDRTKSLIVSRDMMKACLADFAEVEALALDGGKYQDAATSRLAKGIQDNRTIFKAPKSVKNAKLKKAIELALKPQEIYRKATSTAMEVGDLLFSKRAYARSLAGYLTAHGIKNTDLSQVSDALIDEARAYAIKEAQEVTFRDHNALTEILAHSTPAKTTTGRIVKAATQGIMPFRQTPANVLLRAEEYSPLGLLNSIAMTLEFAAGKSKLVNKDGLFGEFARNGQKVTANQLINSFAKTFTGTGLFILGAIFSNLGLAVGGPDDDEGKEKFDKLNGEQNYALKFGDTTWSFDWLSPVSIPFFMGVNFKEALDHDGWSLGVFWNSLDTISEPMMQMSMLQGLNDALDDIRFSDNGLVNFGVNALIDYTMQGMTNSLLAQLERSFETIRYSTYVDKNKEFPNLQYEIGQASSKTPGWDYSQIPYINAWGEEEPSLPFPSRLLYNLLSPSYYGTTVSDEVSKELYRLNDVQDENVFPSTPSKTYKEPKEDKDSPENPERYLTAEEYVELAKVQGTTQRGIVEDLIASDQYANLSDEDKARAIQLAYKYAKEYAQILVLGRKEFSENWMNEIEGSGVDVSTFVAFRSAAADIESDKDKDGEPISGSKKKKIVALIDSLQIPDEQKDALYLSCDYAKSTLNSTPWH